MEHSRCPGDRTGVIVSIPMNTAHPLPEHGKQRRSPERSRGRGRWCACIIAAAAAVSASASVGEARFVRETPTDRAFPLVENGTCATLLVSREDWPGVIRVAADLQADIERVTGLRPPLEIRGSHPPGAVGAPKAVATAVIIGTLERSPLMLELERRGKLDAAPIRRGWEQWIRAVVDDPLPGIHRALVIAGSDKRGAIYGTYSVSEQIGVSPWYWWADVTPTRRAALYVTPDLHVQKPPAVKYRGIFLNDEYPALTRWVQATYGSATPRKEPPVPPGVANYGREFHAHIFEVILRLRGNCLWPAMWNNAFNEDDPENPRLADEYGVVMGTSHQEPMLRAQKEWDRRYRKTIGTWDYAKHPGVLEQFWREGIRRNRAFESLVTIGLRGANDTEMARGGPEKNRAMLERIVERQRAILAEELGPELERVPQVWCLYKEVQDYHDAGMRVPDDVTLLWAEDNWGNVRRLPTAAERKRAGGAGVYYHFDYHGGPRSYQWLNTNPLPKIREQMSLAHAYGADRVWIVNVGHFRGYEVPTEFFLDLAWDCERWNAENTDEFMRLWAQREFGATHAAQIAEVVARYAKYNGRRKPEMLAPRTYSLANYNEAEAVVADFNAIARRAEQLFHDMPPGKRDAFYHLVLFPTKASALVNELYLAAGRNDWYAKQGRAATADMAAETRRLFEADLALMRHYNEVFAGGRWKHFMDQAHLGYTTWSDPPRNSLDAITLVEPVPPMQAGLGVAVEGCDEAFSSGTAQLPAFDSLNRQRYWIDVFNRGRTAFEFEATTDAPWIQLSQSRGSIGPDTRLHVGIDWNAVPAGVATGTITLRGADAQVAVTVRTRTPIDVTRETLAGFAEGSGYVSIEPEHYTRSVPAAAARWIRLEDYGRTLSGMRAEAPAHAEPTSPGRDAPVLEYRVYFHDAGPVEIIAITSPTLNFVPGRGLRYAVSIDDATPQVLTLVPAGYKAEHHNPDWEKVVGDNARHSRSRHRIDRPGYHTVRIWMVDPGVVLQKLIVDCGGLRPSYLGPPESFRR